MIRQDRLPNATIELDRLQFNGESLDRLAVIYLSTAARSIKEKPCPMNVKLVESLIQIIQSLTLEERLVLDARLQNDSSQESSRAVDKPDADSDGEPILHGSKASDLLKFAGTWEGNDFEECLKLVYETRSNAEF